MCIDCSGRHRSYGVAKSVVRSIHMDAWSHSQILAMLEGGNAQLETFFDRHKMGSSSPTSSKRYHTKGAEFYRNHLGEHAKKVAHSGEYKGREASRRQPRRPSTCRRDSLKNVSSHSMEQQQSAVNAQ
jgi:hypothetical protein